MAITRSHNADGIEDTGPGIRRATQATTLEARDRIGMQRATGISRPQSSYVQYGSSWVSSKGWVNFDSSPTLKWERIPILGRFTKNPVRFPPEVRFGDIVAGLPVPDGTCKGVYASHVLEHLCLEDFHKALDNTYRMLEKSGIFRVVVPDLEWWGREYVAALDRGDANSSSIFMRGTNLGIEKKEGGLIGAARRMFNTSAHLWMWDEASLGKALADHSFVSIRRCQFGDCEDSMFSIVESPGRFEKAVAFEARR